MKNINRNLTYLLLAGVVFVQFAGMFLPFTGDAGKYAAISKTIFQTNNFWDLYIHNSPYYQKPPLFMWLISGGYYLTGITSNFTTRIFPLLFSILTIFSTYKIASYFYTKEIGKIAALFMATTEIFIFYNSEIHTDSALTACTTTAIWQLAKYIDQRKWHNFVLGFVFIGMAMLTKGPIGIVVPVLAVGTHLLFKRDYRSIFKIEWLVGLVIIALIIAPHLWILYHHFEWEGIKFFFWTNNAGRISGTYKGGSTDPWFYFYNLLVFTIPWSVFFAGGMLKQLWLMVKLRQGQIKEYYTIGGAFLLIFILSFAKMKSPNYFYPAIPLLAVLAAHFYQSLKTSSVFKWLPTIQFAINMFIWIGLTVVLAWMFPLQNNISWVLYITAFILFLKINVSTHEIQPKILNSSLITIVVLNLLVNTHVLPYLFSYQASVHASKIYNEKATDTDNFYTYRYAQFEMFFYAKTSGDKIIDEGTHYDPLNIELDEALTDKGAWFFTDEYGYHEIKNQIKVENEYEFEHYYLTDVNWNFLNPQTRGASLKKMYLIQTMKE
jgi:4-amino-4-deoxy-L-arabinose transferase-like glycosyltransferase